MPDKLFLDFETRSLADLRKVGAHRYARDESTQVLCLGWSYGEQSGIWRPAWLGGTDPLPAPFHDPSIPRVAHNAEFDRLIWENLLDAPVGTEWECTAVLAAGCGLPRNLDDASRVLLGEDGGKDKDGALALRRISRPATSGKGKGQFRKQDAAFWTDLELVERYCVRDVLIMRCLHDALPPWSDDERDLYRVDQAINARGLPINADELAQVLDKIKQRTEREKRDAPVNLNSPQQLIEWARGHGYDLPDARRATIEQAADDPQCPPEVRRWLTVRSELAMASVKKYGAIDARRVQAGADDWRLRGQFAMNGGHTGRWASWGVQVQNLNRQTLDDEEVERVFGEGTDPPPLSTFARGVRQIFKARPGYKFAAGDYKTIEVCVLFALAREQYGLSLLNDEDRDIYVEFAAQVGEGQPRQLGKVGVLGCGFGCGPARFLDMARDAPYFLSDLTPPMAERTVYSYRETFAAVPQFWRDLEDAFKYAMRGKACRVNGLLTFRGDGRGLVTIELPSGRKVYYRECRSSPGGYGDELSYLNVSGSRLKLWGGILCENVVQAVANDLLRFGLIFLDLLGYEIVLHAHDEIVCHVKENSCLNTLCSAMAVKPEWAKDIPVRIEGGEGPRYTKF